jgi:hypothetical protein
MKQPQKNRGNRKRSWKAKDGVLIIFSILAEAAALTGGLMQPSFSATKA